MKKFILFLGLFLAFNANAMAEDSVNKQEFVNPIFYQPLSPMSMSSGYTYLTPTFIKFMTPLDKDLINGEGKCELLENKENFIKLRCSVGWKILEQGKMVTHISDDIYTYEIKELSFDTCLDIEEIIYGINEKEGHSITHYCVTPPDNFQLKLN